MHIFQLQLNNRDLPKRRPKGDPLKIFVIIQRGPFIEVIHAAHANAKFGGRIKQTREDSCDERFTTVVHCAGAIDPTNRVCGDVGEGGVVKSDGSGADDEDGGRGEDDSEAVAMLGAAYVFEIGALVGLPVVDERLGGAVIECYDSTTEGDLAEVRVEGADSVQCPVATQTEEHDFL